MLSSAALRAAVVGLCFSLTACGGGSGGGGGGTTSGGGPVSGTGLIPSPQAAGATLVNDATTLRPLIAGAKWIYAGTDSQNGFTDKYSNIVTQSSSGGAFTETGSDSFHAGVDTANIAASAGSITSTSQTALPSGPNQQISFQELRSPVRQNDQVTVLDQHFADLGHDFDGDGKNDSGDLAIYRQVIGMDDISLSDGSIQHAVRVDTIGLARITYSKSGTTSQAVQVALQSTWYAAGIGIIKQRLTVPISDTSNQVTEEILTYFDGVDRGLGSSPAIGAQVAPDAGSRVGLPLQSVDNTVVFPDHVVVIGRFDDAAGAPTAISSIDTSGNVTHTSFYSGLLFSSFKAVGGQLISLTPSDAPRCQVELARYDANGRQAAGAASTTIVIAPSTGQTICTDLPQLKFASDGNRFWIAAVRQSLSVNGWVTDLMVRPYDVNGLPLAPETTVFTANGLLNSNLSLGPGIDFKSISAAAGKVFISYRTDNSGNVNLAAVSSDGSVTHGSVAPIVANADSPTLLASPSSAVLLWQGPSDGPFGMAPTRGVLLDGNLNPVLAPGSTGIDSQTLSTTLSTDVGGGFLLNGTGDAILIGKSDMPSDTTGTLTLGAYMASAGALAAQTVAPISISLADFSATGRIDQMQLAPLGNRVLVMVASQSKLYVKVAWLH